MCLDVNCVDWLTMVNDVARLKTSIEEMIPSSSC